MRVFCLSVHAAYACRHSGACCTTPWPIFIEPRTVRQLRERDEIAKILDRVHDAPYVGRRDDGACVFFEAERGHLCTIHRVAGPALLPSACRHFPRVVLHDPRGTFITLSSFCPTAAAMLQRPAPLCVVEAPPSLALGGTLEGLDATTVLPPLLRPGVLMDYEGYTAWEHAALAVLGRDDLTAEDAVEAIAAATEHVQRWQPGAAPLAAHVLTAFEQLRGGRDGPRAAGSRPLRMFLAAHLFGSWAAYQDGGLGGVVRAVRNALRLVQRELTSGASFIEAARAADLKLRHTQETSGNACA